LPAIEAMANDCLVVASDIPSLKEICQDAAVILTRTIFHSIANALRKVYTDQAELLKNKQFGKERAQQFSWEKTARETLAVYESCISLR